MIRTRTLSRRRVLAGTGAAVASLGFPAVLRAQAQVVKIGILHPVTGALSYSGTQARHGARIRIEEINAAGGIKSLAGAKIEPIYADCEIEARRHHRRSRQARR